MIKEIKIGENTGEDIVLVLGFFDCVHAGHAALINRAREIAENKKLKTCVFTFSNALPSFFNKSGLILSYRERVEKLGRLGVDYVMSAEFNRDMMNFPPDSFLRSVIGENVKAAVCGYDYTFGKNASGNAEFLKKFCFENGVSCEVEKEVLLGGERISATGIKKLLAVGEVEKAEVLLGEPYFISGKVVEGRKVGRTMGFPTANVIPDGEKIRVRTGVYQTEVSIGGRLYKGVTNYGGRPTFGLGDILTETYIAGFDGNLYGEEITVYFKKFMRDDVAFSSETELKKQLEKDLETVIK